VAKDKIPTKIIPPIFTQISINRELLGKRFFSWKTPLTWQGFLLTISDLFGLIQTYIHY
ncbi:13964_t:CDS:1, partial [Dentiscutata erythropus]